MVSKEDKTAGVVLVTVVGWVVLSLTWIMLYNINVAIPISFTAFMVILTTAVLSVIRKKK